MITPCVRRDSLPRGPNEAQIRDLPGAGLAPDQGEHASEMGAMAVPRGPSEVSIEGHVLGQGAINPFVYLCQPGFYPSTPQQQCADPRHIGGVAQHRTLATRLDGESLCRS